MTIAQLIEMCERRLVHLNAVRGSAVALGDLNQIDEIDGQIASTTETRNLLMTLL